jgi:hypothetical protein
MHGHGRVHTIRGEGGLKRYAGESGTLDLSLVNDLSLIQWQSPIFHLMSSGFDFESILNLGSAIRVWVSCHNSPIQFRSTSTIYPLFTHLTSIPPTFSNLQQTHLTHNSLSNHTPTLLPFTSTTNMVTTLEFSALFPPFASSPYTWTPSPRQQKQPKKRKQ